MFSFPLLLTLMVVVGSSYATTVVDDSAESSGASLSLPLCGEAVCVCSAPNVFPGDITFMANGTSGCLCECGRDAGEACDVEDHCARGTTCVAPLDFTNIDDKTMGVCEDKCTRMECPQYFKCRLEMNEPVCFCDAFKCSPDVEEVIEASRVTDSGVVQAQIFLNNCEMVNENCVLSADDPRADLWHQVSYNSEAGIPITPE